MQSVSDTTSTHQRVFRWLLCYTPPHQQTKKKNNDSSVAFVVRNAQLFFFVLVLLRSIGVLSWVVGTTRSRITVVPLSLHVSRHGSATGFGCSDSHLLGSGTSCTAGCTPAPTRTPWLTKLVTQAVTLAAVKKSVAQAAVQEAH